MSDASQGPGWWRASNGKWYPPEAKPGQRRPPGVPQMGRPDPKVQQPFTPRVDQTLERDRARERRRRDRHQTDRGAPWGWIGLGVLVLVFGGVGTWLALTAGGSDGDGDDSVAADTTTTVPDDTATSESANVTISDEVSVFDLAVGDCFTAAPSDGDAGPLVTTAEVVSCDDPHLAEVVLIGDLSDADGAAFPGVEERDDAAEDLCQPAFMDYVGVPLAASELGLLWLAPTEESWTEQDDREVTCAVQALDGDPLTGSVEGSER
jgi:Septum formation